jgi:hypothetical protein
MYFVSPLTSTFKNSPVAVIGFENVGVLTPYNIIVSALKILIA